MAQSLRQQWAFERLFRFKGTIHSVCTLLNSAALHKSTLRDEKIVLLKVVKKLRNIDPSLRQEKSWNQYCRRANKEGGTQ